MSDFSAAKRYAFQTDSITLRPIAELFELPEGIVFAYPGWCEPSGCSFNPFDRVHIEDLHKIVEVLPGSEEHQALDEWHDQQMLLGDIASSERCLEEVRKLYPDAHPLS